jgi:hypothetical protein
MIRERRENAVAAVPHVFPAARPSVVESIAEFYKDLSGIIPMESAEGDAVINFVAAIGDVERVE